MMAIIIIILLVFTTEKCLSVALMRDPKPWGITSSPSCSAFLSCVTNKPIVPVSVTLGVIDGVAVENNSMEPSNEQALVYVMLLLPI